MIQLEVNAVALVASLQGKAARLGDGIERGVERVAEIAEQQKVRKVGRTSARAIPRSKRGRPLWKRTGNWARGQAIEKQGRFGRVLRTIGPAEAYEPVLATLPTSRDGVNRRNDAATDAFETIEPQAQPVFEQEILNALND